jgi:hypothetical protein
MRQAVRQAEREHLVGARAHRFRTQERERGQGFVARRRPDGAPQYFSSGRPTGFGTSCSVGGAPGA